MRPIPGSRIVKTLIACGAASLSACSTLHTHSGYRPVDPASSGLSASSPTCDLSPDAGTVLQVPLGENRSARVFVENVTSSYWIGPPLIPLIPMFWRKQTAREIRVLSDAAPGSEIFLSADSKNWMQARNRERPGEWVFTPPASNPLERLSLKIRTESGKEILIPLEEESRHHYVPFLFIHSEPPSRIADCP